MGTLGGWLARGRGIAASLRCAPRDPNPPAMIRGEQSSSTPHAISASLVSPGSLTHRPRSSNLEPAGVADERRDRLAVAVQRRAPLRFAQRRAARVTEPGGA